MAKNKPAMSTTSPVVSVTPIHNFISEMPRGYNGKPLYSSGNAMDVFMAMLPGISAKQLKTMATDHTKHYVFGRHMTALGRCGLKFSLLLDGKTIHDGPLDINSLDDSAMVRPCNVRPATTSDGKTVVVNSTFKRSAAVTLDEIIAARTAKQSATVETPKPAGSIPLGSLPANVIKPVVDAVIANAETPKRKPATKRKRS